MKKASSSGFSLVEMSIVIVVMALIVAAAMQGVNMIEKAKLRNVLSEISDIKMAINSFKTKYDKLPGDFDKAVAYWGATTENGDADGKIEFVNGSTIYEGYRAWQHLAYAQMVKTPYLGTETTGAAELGKDVPESKIGGGYFVEYDIFGLTEMTSLAFGVPVATSVAPILVNGVITPAQAQELDNKVDDGEPMTGTVRGADGNGSASNTCINAGADTTDGTSDDYYNITLDGKDCTMAFKLLDG